MVSAHAVSYRQRCSTVLSAADCTPTAVKTPVPGNVVDGRPGHGLLTTGGGGLFGGGGGVLGGVLHGGTNVTSHPSQTVGHVTCPKSWTASVSANCCLSTFY